MLKVLALLFLSESAIAFAGPGVGIVMINGEELKTWDHYFRYRLARGEVIKLKDKEK